MKYTLKERILELRLQERIVRCGRYKGMRFAISKHGGYWCGYINSTKNYDTSHQIPYCSSVKITYVRGSVIGFSTNSSTASWCPVPYAYAKSQMLKFINAYRKAPKRLKI